MRFREYCLIREAMDDDIIVGDIRIPRAELNFRFDASGGPGGQNVNKVATKATLRWNVKQTQLWLTSDHGDVLRRFMEMFANRINKRGEVVLQSQAQRSQRQNMYQCIVKLGEMMVQAATPNTVRIETKPSKSRQEKRLKDKAVHGWKKQERRRNKGGWE